MRKNAFVLASEKAVKRKAISAVRVPPHPQKTFSRPTSFHNPSDFERKMCGAYGLAFRDKGGSFEPAAFSKVFAVAGAVGLVGPILMNGADR
jgi:hypothetical protein